MRHTRGFCTFCDLIGGSRKSDPAQKPYSSYTRPFSSCGCTIEGKRLAHQTAVCLTGGHLEGGAGLNEGKHGSRNGEGVLVSSGSVHMCLLQCMYIHTCIMCVWGACVCILYRTSTHEHTASSMAVSSSIQGAKQPSNHVSPGVCV